MQIRAACHLHSEWSYDGSWSLAALTERFSRRGYRVLLMTEHDRGFTQRRFDDYRLACSGASNSDILIVPGIEYSDAANRVHVLTWGVPFFGEGLPTGELLQAVREANGVAVLAHPSRGNAWLCFEPHWGSKVLGIEIWNRKYDGWAPSKTAPALLQTGDPIPFVGMDFHTERQSFPLAMALDIHADVTEGAVLDCLRSRRCCAHAFGVPFDQQLLRTLMPALSIADWSRRKAVSIVRRSRALRADRHPRPR